MNNVLDHIWWNFSCEGQNGGNNGGNMMYNYGLDCRDLGEYWVKYALSNSTLNCQPGKGSCEMQTLYVQD